MMLRNISDARVNIASEFADGKICLATIRLFQSYSRSTPMYVIGCRRHKLLIGSSRYVRFGIGPMIFHPRSARNRRQK